MGPFFGKALLIDCTQAGQNLSWGLANLCLGGLALPVVDQQASTHLPAQLINPSQVFVSYKAGGAAPAKRIPGQEVKG